MKGFKKDLERGKYYEHKALKTLTKHGFKELKIFDGYKKEYDIEGIYNNKKVFIECKYNKYTTYTNKFFIEVFTTKFNESGITATKSDYYILYSYFDYWIIYTNDLKRALEEHLRSIIQNKDVTKTQIVEYIKTNGTYTNNTIGVIIPINIIEKYTLWKGNHKKRPTNNMNLFN
jgi:Holliday junction resolvase